MKSSLITLRVKLTLWALSIFALLLSTIGIALEFVRVGIKSRRLDVELDRSAREVAKSLSVSSGPVWQAGDLDLLTAQASRAHELQRFFAQVRDPYGLLIASSHGADLSWAPLHTAAEAEKGGTFLQALRTDLGSGVVYDLRMITLPFRDAAGNDWILQMTTPEPRSRELAQAVQYLFLVRLPIGMLAAGVATWVLVGRAVRPIKRMADAAKRVSPSDFERRVDVGPVDAEVARLQHEINDALERLEKGYRAQGMFINHVAHELKTPIAVLLSAAQVLKAGERPLEEYRAFVSDVEEEMRILGRLTESFLTMARASHGKALVRRETVNVNDVALEAAQHCEKTARETGVHLSSHLYLARGGEPEPELEGDAELLRIMIENLLRNALRNSPRGATVELQVWRDAKDAVVSVRDRGPGIPPEHFARIFEPFFQVPRDTTPARGTGLGLAIVKGVVDLHGGRINAANCTGGGCAFVVRVPLVPVTESRRELA